MSRNTFFISCPYDTYSGYGARARDLVKAIIELDKYDVKLLPQRWGGTAWGFCNNNPEWSFLHNYKYPHQQLTEKPDIWMQITIPNEFQPIGKYNIGVTAGIESNLCQGTWVEGLNRMDLTLVSSNHAKQVFEKSIFQKQDKNQQPLGEIKLEKPVEVLFEGVDLTKYFEIPSQEMSKLRNNSPLIQSLDSIPESFAYLFVGHWIQGDFGEDRKNVGLLIKAFLEVFKNKKTAPALILKTSSAVSSYMDRDEILKKIHAIRKTIKANSIPNIYLLHGEFSDNEMNELYNHPKVKSMVSLTKGEGFGRPLLEFSLSKKPIIASGWSGHTDFLTKDFSLLIGGNLKNVHPSAANDWLMKESQWFEPNHNEVGMYLKDVFENYKKYTDKGKRQAYFSKTNFSWNKMKEKANTLFTQYIPDLPKKVELKLPQIKKIELPKKPVLNG
jgi:glycosyltransferase involved in cell wall biosynthesis